MSTQNNDILENSYYENQSTKTYLKAVNKSSKDKPKKPYNKNVKKCSNFSLEATK